MRRFIGFAAVALIITIFAAAQDATPTPAPLACATSDLKLYYTALVEEAQAAFDAAPSDTGKATADPAVLATLYEAGKSLQARMLACGYIPDDIQSLPVGADTPLERVLEVLDTLTPDLLRGQALYLGEEPTGADNTILGCAGCHEGGAIGPATDGTWTRWDEQHALLPEYADLPFEYFAVEAVLHPNAHVAEPYIANLMPPFYAQSLTYQDLADIVAFLSSQDQLLED